MIRLAAPLLIALSAACANAAEPEMEIPEARTVALSFTSGGVTLSGTLWVPEGEGRHPAVVLMGGNGPWRPAHWYFDILRDAFMAQGFAVAYYDRRGEGGSTGDFDRASFDDLADDAIAAVNAVRANPAVDPSKAGLWGHSMGGWIAGLAASRSPSVAFVITAAGPGVSPLEQTLFARANEDRAAGIPEADVLELAALRQKIVQYYVGRTAEQHAIAESAFAAAREKPWFPTATAWPELRGVGAQLPSPATLASIDAGNPDVLRWFRRDGKYDPSQAFVKVNVPYLAVFGEADRIVPLGPSVAALEASVPKGKLTVNTYPSANHMIMVAGGQTASALAPGYVDGMTAWLKSTAVR